MIRRHLLPIVCEPRMECTSVLSIRGSLRDRGNYHLLTTNSVETPTLIFGFYTLGEFRCIPSGVVCIGTKYPPLKSKTLLCHPRHIFVVIRWHLLPVVCEPRMESLSNSIRGALCGCFSLPIYYTADRMAVKSPESWRATFGAFGGEMWRLLPSAYYSMPRIRTSQMPSNSRCRRSRSVCSSTCP